MFYGHLCEQSRLNGPSDLHRYWGRVKDETPLRHAQAEIWTWVVEICGQPGYQLDHGGALSYVGTVLLRLNKMLTHWSPPWTLLNISSLIEKLLLKFHSIYAFMKLCVCVCVIQSSTRFEVFSTLHQYTSSFHTSHNGMFMCIVLAQKYKKSLDM